MMDGGSGIPIQDLCEEATCPICLDYFKDPVTLECGHNFCQGCLRRCWEETEAEASCPQCREKIQQRHLRPNQQLSNFVEITKKLKGQGAKGDEGNCVLCNCEKHQEPLKLFCKDDETPICVVCDRSKEHKNHEVVPVEEASQEYKDQICNCLESLKKEREDIQASKAASEKESQDLLKQIEAERQKTTVELRKLRQFLDEQETLRLAQMEELEKVIIQIREKNLASLSQELSSLESLIQEMEEKHQQPASKLLQDVRRILMSTEKRENLEKTVAFPPWLTWMISDIFDISPFLEIVLKQLKDTFFSRPPLQKANITLDPDTAFPQLVVSEDCKSVTCGDKPRDLPDFPERFDKCAYVLGCEGFTAGRHFWEVFVETEEEWAVGVARKSVRRKGCVSISPEEGIWAVGKWDGAYRVPDSHAQSVLSLRREPKTIAVSLNCAGGRVAFYDTDTRVLLHIFSGVSFSGEALLPFFWLRGQRANIQISFL
ncbi:zinc finger protein RFP-like isoform X2 [Sceloporus undulatus]|nr:zinc finger protein RFP-like isoform X2 [Sceloporus undulatus]XP_042306622.1 zinc finger protein RFP-like isoform X2 [Sceloporus undulatus]XP_042306623.1 zinc finger protein RFP-like isoform X2 [Sceloporus undulatus]XP_042306624.1 zinc finger protein RFP-like isoform X2 [Sceloporus undulatus]